MARKISQISVTSSKTADESYVEISRKSGTSYYTEKMNLQNFSGAVKVTGNYTAGAIRTILVDATAGNIAITLPAVSDKTGISYIIKKIDASANTVTITGNAYIDGKANKVLNTQYQSIEVISDGTTWWSTRSHAIDSTLDHTSTATPGKILKADANGLPVSATNTDTEVSSAVTNSHTHSNKSTLDNIQEALTSTLKTNYDAAYTHTTKTDNPHSVTKAQVGLGSVTDDAQLKRAAGDINSFTLKTTPAVNDVVIIEDSADSYNKKKATTFSMGGTNYEAENGFETIAYGSIDADTLDGLHASAFILHSLATAANDFLVASGAGIFVKKTLSEVQNLITSILSMDTIYDRGSVVNVDNTDVKFKLSTGKHYKFMNSGESATYLDVDGDGNVISRLSNDAENGFEIITY